MKTLVVRAVNGNTNPYTRTGGIHSNIVTITTMEWRGAFRLVRYKTPAISIFPSRIVRPTHRYVNIVAA